MSSSGNMSFPRTCTRSPEDASTTPKIISMEDSFPSSSHLIAKPVLPDGGVAAWCTVLGAFLALFCGFGYTNSFGVYQAFYAQQYLENETASAISWIGSLAAFLATAIGPICGPLFDNGYFHHVFIAGAILQSVSLFMLSLVQPGSYYQVFLAQGVMSGIGQGLMYVPSFAILSHHFEHRRTAAMTLVASGASLGGIVHTIMLNKLLNGPMGFKTGIRISAAFVTVLLFLSCVLVRSRYNSTHQERTPVNFWKATKKCFTEMPSLLTILAFTLFQVAYMYPYFYFQVDSLQHGLGTSISFYSSVYMSAGSSVGRIAASFLLAFVGVVDQTIMTTIACGILIIGMIWLRTVASVISLGILFGFFSGINIAVMAPMLGLTSNPAELGVRMGVGFAITGVGDLVGPPICGALLTSRYIWWAPALFCGALSSAAALMFVGVRILLSRAAATRKNPDSEGNGNVILEKKGIETNVGEVNTECTLRGRHDPRLDRAAILVNDDLR